MNETLFKEPENPNQFFEKNVHQTKQPPAHTTLRHSVFVPLVMQEEKLDFPQSSES